jgi:hypothetical protein
MHRFYQNAVFHKLGFFLLSKATALMVQRIGSGAIYSTAARILHVFHLHYDVSIPETAALRRQHVFHLHYDVSLAEIPALLSKAILTYCTARHCAAKQSKYLAPISYA